MHFPKFVLLAIFAFSLNSFSASKGLTPAQSLDEDLSGSAVTWIGQITESYEVGSDACLLLNKIDDNQSGAYVAAANKFITCTTGSIQDDMFLNGRFLEVRGNLGKNILRSIGGRDIQAHLIAAPIIKSVSDVQVQSNRRFSNDPFYRGYDPFFYDPWYPHGGIGIGIGHYHRHRWHRH